MTEIIELLPLPADFDWTLQQIEKLLAEQIAELGGRAVLDADLRRRERVIDAPLVHPEIVSAVRDLIARDVPLQRYADAPPVYSSNVEPAIDPDDVLPPQPRLVTVADFVELRVCMPIIDGTAVDVSNQLALPAAEEDGA